MARVPPDFAEEFAAKGATFNRIAELLYTNPDRQYTRDELADQLDCSTTTIDNHTETMSEWLDRRNGQTTYAWNTNAHNPRSTEGLAAVKQFYADLVGLFRKHSRTAPGTYAIMGFAMGLAGSVVFAFYVGFSLSITGDSAIPVVIYLAIAVGSFLTGLFVTFLSPLQAWVTSVVWSRMPTAKVEHGEK